MVKFEKLFINFMIVGLLIFGMIAFVSLTQEENSIDDKFTDSNLISSTYANLSEDLTT